MYFDLLLPDGTIQHSYTKSFAEPPWVQGLQLASDVSNAFVEWLGTLSQPNIPLKLPIDFLAPR